ncbi:MAG: NAD-dependent malic enzyme, partial [Clostridia bacterium]|nr:NAD-dependent malic enzyme [Clostridia bacterium]
YKEIFTETNTANIQGNLKDALRGADIFIGLSRPNTVNVEMIKSMAEAPVVFAMANPTPEIMPEDAKNAGAIVVGTGRSDCFNQINNVLAFPGIFRGALDVRATDITEGMKLAAAYAIADLVSEKELAPDYVIPNPFDKRVSASVANSVAKAAMDEGIARVIKKLD